MGILDGIYNGIAKKVASILEGTEEQNRKTGLRKLADYYSGAQTKPLKVRINQYDDNLILNQVGLIVDRTVSMLFGPGVEIKLESDPAQEEIDNIFRVNKKELWLLTLGMYGAT